MTTLYLDAFSGASGNMLLGCLLDLGVSQEQLRQAIDEMQRIIEESNKYGVREQLGVLYDAGMYKEVK